MWTFLLICHEKSELLSTRCRTLQRYYMPTSTASELPTASCTKERTTQPGQSVSIFVPQKYRAIIQHRDYQQTCQGLHMPSLRASATGWMKLPVTTCAVCMLKARSHASYNALSQLCHSCLAGPSLQGGKQLCREHSRPHSINWNKGSSCCSSHGQCSAESSGSVRRRSPRSNRIQAASSLCSPMTNAVLRIARASEWIPTLCGG